MPNENASLVMKPRQVTDAQSGLVAYTYLAPEEWDIQDSVKWDYYYMFNPAHLFAHCYNNNGLTIQIHAGYSNQYWANPMGNSGNTPPRDITDALKIYLPWLRGANVQFTEATILSSVQQPGLPGYNSTTMITTQHGRIRGNYEKDGVRFDEILYGTMTLTHMRQPPDFMGFFYDDITWEINDLFLSCVSGNRDPESGVATALSIKSSVRQTQQFYDYEQQTINRLRQQQKQHNETVKETGRIMKETNDYINKTYEEINKNRQIAFAKNNERFLDYIKDVEHYTDGKGTEYQLPTGYQSAWISSLGKVVLADKDSLDPYLYDTSYETWTRLDKKKY